MPFIETSITELYELEARLLASIKQLTYLKSEAAKLLSEPLTNEQRKIVETSDARLDESLWTAREALHPVLLEIIDRSR